MRGARRVASRASDLQRRSAPEISASDVQFFDERTFGRASVPGRPSGGWESGPWPGTSSVGLKSIGRDSDAIHCRLPAVGCRLSAWRTKGKRPQNTRLPASKTLRGRSYVTKYATKYATRFCRVCAGPTWRMSKSKLPTRSVASCGSSQRWASTSRVCSSICACTATADATSAAAACPPSPGRLLVRPAFHPLARLLRCCASENYRATASSISVSNGVDAAAARWTSGCG